MISDIILPEDLLFAFYSKVGGVHCVPFFLKITIEKGTNPSINALFALEKWKKEHGPAENRSCKYY